MRHDKTSLLADPDRRYWRRRVNRRVRKARRLRGLLRGSVLLAINLAVVGVLGYSGQRAVRHLQRCEGFALRDIRVDGTQRTAPDAIRAALGDLLGHNLFGIDLEAVVGRVQQEPWVESCSVRRVLPATISVVVSERDPRARVRVAGSLFVVDRGGTLLQPDNSDAALPVLHGFDRMSDEQRASALLQGVAALERLREAAGDWIDEVAEIDLSRSDRLSVRTRTRGPRILLDPDRVERNLRGYLTLKREIDSRVGPTEYIDLRWSDRIAVMPARHSGGEL